MAQQIEVPGMGIVEFPDDMGDDQIAAAIKANQPAATEQPSPTSRMLQGDPLRVGEWTGGGPAISIGEAVKTAPYWAAIGERFVQAKRGISQLFATREEAENIAQVTADEVADRERYLAQHPEERAAYGLGRNIATIAESVTAARLIPGAQALGLGGRGIPAAAGRVGYGAATGGALAATQPTAPGETKGEQTAKGAAFVAAPTAAAEVVSAAARPLASLFTTKKGAEASGGLLTETPAYERGVALKEATGVELSPGQLTGSPFLSEMRPPKGFAEKQAKQTLRYFTAVRDQFTKNPKPPTELAQRFSAATDDIYKQAVEVRKRVGDFRYGKFKGSVKAISADRLAAKMDEIASEAIPGTDEGKVALMRAQLTKQLDETGGSLTPEQILGWKKRFDDLLAGKSDIFKDLGKANQKRLGGQLMDSLHDSLTQTADELALTGQLSPANLLKQAVSDYKKYSAPLKELEESALGAIFRSRGPDGRVAKVTPELAARKLMQMEPTQVKGVYSLLQQYNPHLIREYQATKLYQAMKSSVKITPETAGRLASQTKFNPQAAIKELTNKNGLRAVFEQDPALMRRVQNGVALLDRVSDRITSASGGRQGMASRNAEIARNIFSGSSIFIAGTAAKVLGPAGLWKLTSTDGGIKTLRTLATAPLNSQRYAAALESAVMNLDDEGEFSARSEAER